MTLRRYELITGSLAKAASVIEVLAWILIFINLRYHIIGSSALGLVLGGALFACWGFLCALPMIRLDHVVIKLGYIPNEGNLQLALSTPAVARRISAIVVCVPLMLWIIIDVTIAMSSPSLILPVSIYLFIRVTTLVAGRFVGRVLMWGAVKAALGKGRANSGGIDSSSNASTMSS